MQNKSSPRNKSEPKKVWDHPTLTIFGSVETLTQSQCFNKKLGDADGFTLGQNNPIGDDCS